MCWRSRPYYKDWASIGAGVGNYMAYGDYPEDDSANPQLFLPTGIIHNRDLTKLDTVDQAKITEQVAHSWYDYSVGDDKGLNPFKGETIAALYRTEAALSEAGCRAEIQLAEIAAL